MGNSSLVGKAKIEPCLMQFTLWRIEDIKKVKERFTSINSSFALNLEQFQFIVKLSLKEAKPVFELFDTDKNSLIDSFECLGSLAFLSAADLDDKVTFLYNLFDFSGQGKLSQDETTILMRSIVVGMSKVDKNINDESTDTIVKIVERSFQRAKRDPDDEITLEEFNMFCRTSTLVNEFLEYIDGAAGHAAVTEDELWVDEHFRNEISSFYRNSMAIHEHRMPWPNVQFISANELCPDEVTVSTHPLGILQSGHLANHWFLNALQLLAATRPDCIQHLFIKTGQEQKHGRYCLQFHKNGNWLLSFIDSTVPCDIIQGKPLFARGEDPNEAWMFLIEKAYAKLHGSYEAVVQGSVVDALHELTGGIAERSPLEDNGDGLLWPFLNACFIDGVVGAMYDPADGDFTLPPAARHGLQSNRIYPICGLKQRGNDLFVQLRVPDTDSHSYVPGDGSPIWRNTVEMHRASGYGVLPSEEKSQAESQHFFMCLGDFVDSFNVLYSCRIFEQHWNKLRVEGKWNETNARGNLMNSGWSNNDQYCMQLEEDSEVHITLYQQDHRLSHLKQFKHAIGFAVFQHDFGDEAEKTKVQQMSDGNLIFLSAFEYQGRVSAKLNLSFGRYIVMPMCYSTGSRATYSLVVAAESSLILVGEPDLSFNGDPPARNEDFIPLSAEQIRDVTRKDEQLNIHRDCTTADQQQAMELRHLYTLVHDLFDVVDELKDKKQQLLLRLEEKTQAQ